MNILTPNMTGMYEDNETSASFIEAMATAVTPVSIVTTDGPAGRFGMTVSAVTSLSADPPMVLACINRKSPALDTIKHNGVFCINMLNVEQSTLADCFAGKSDCCRSYDFGQAEWQSLATGSPVLCEAAAAFDCMLEATQDAGTHSIIIGNVMSVRNSGHSPLAYTDRTYQALHPMPFQQGKGA